MNALFCFFFEHVCNSEIPHIRMKDSCFSDQLNFGQEHDRLENMLMSVTVDFLDDQGGKGS